MNFKFKIGKSRLHSDFHVCYNPVWKFCGTSLKTPFALLQRKQANKNANVFFHKFAPSIQWLIQELGTGTKIHEFDDSQRYRHFLSLFCMGRRTIFTPTPNSHHPQPSLHSSTNMNTTRKFSAFPRIKFREKHLFFHNDKCHHCQF